MLHLQKPLIAPRPPFGVNWNSEQARGLEYWWPGPEMGGNNALDLAQNVRATPTGMEALDAQRTQQGSRLWNFDNTGGAVFASEYLDTGLTIDGTFTGLSFWVVFDSPSGVLQVSGLHDSSTQRFYIGLTATGGQRFIIGVGDSFHNTTAHGFSAGELHLLTVTFDGTTARFYVDGSEAFNFAATWTGTSTRTLWVGARSHSTSETPVNGAMRDVRLFRNITPTAAAIADMYNPATRHDLYWRPGRATYFVPEAAPPSDYVPYPRYQMTGGMQPMGGV